MSIRRRSTEYNAHVVGMFGSQIASPLQQDAQAMMTISDLLVSTAIPLLTFIIIPRISPLNAITIYPLHHSNPPSFAKSYCRRQYYPVVMKKDHILHDILGFGNSRGKAFQFGHRIVPRQFRGDSVVLRGIKISSKWLSKIARILMAKDCLPLSSRIPGNKKYYLLNE
jgi:hypothetical protein